MIGFSLNYTKVFANKTTLLRCFISNQFGFDNFNVVSLVYIKNLENNAFNTETTKNICNAMKLIRRVKVIVFLINTNQEVRTAIQPLLVWRCRSLIGCYNGHFKETCNGDQEQRKCSVK